MQSKLKEWEEKNLYIFFLPRYSPHLNLIEGLWRKMKYEWLKPEDYASFEKLTEAVKKILREIGNEYMINSPYAVNDFQPDLSGFPRFAAGAPRDFSAWNSANKTTQGVLTSFEKA